MTGEQTQGPRVSDDGRFWWDGDRWQLMPQDRRGDGRAGRRVRRGLGFVLIAVVLWVLMVVVLQLELPMWAVNLIGWPLLLGMLGCGLYGLFSVVTGLLRD